MFMRQAERALLQQELRRLQQIETAQFAEIVQLQESADCWNSICQYAPLVLVTINQDGVINTLSHGDISFLHQDIQTGSSVIYDCFVSPHIEALRQAIELAFKDGQNHSCDLHLSLDEVWLEVAVMPLPSEKNHVETKECLLRIQDISDRQLARSQLADAHWQLSERMIAKEQAHEQQATLQILYSELEAITRLGVWEQDLLTGEYTLSDQLYQLFGLDPKLRVHDATILGVISKQQRQQFSRCLKDALKLHLNFDQTFTVTNANDETFSARYRGRPSVDGGYTTRLTGTVQDVSEQVKLQQDLLKTRQKIEASTQTKSHYINNLSHEVLSPMQEIYETAMALQCGEEKQQNYVEIMRQSALQLLTLLGNILDYGRIESGQLTLHSDRLNLSALLLSEVDKVREQANEKGLKIECEFDQTLPTTILSDGKRITEIIANLLDNAIKFTDLGGIKITLTANNVQKGFCNCEVSIKDSGIGIAEENLDTIFDNFYQADASATRQAQGLGLGLTIARHLVHLMGGELSVTSTLGQGSEFCFRLPLQIGHGTINNAIQVQRNYHKKVLLCDYDPCSQQTIRHSLLQIGISTWAVNCKREFEEALQSHQYDLVLLDCNLPDLEHMSTLHQHQEVAKMSITSNFDRHLVADCIAAGSEAVFAKPLQSPALICEFDRFFHAPGH